MGRSEREYERAQQFLFTKLSVLLILLILVIAGLIWAAQHDYLRWIVIGLALLIGIPLLIWIFGIIRVALSWSTETPKLFTLKREERQEQLAAARQDRAIRQSEEDLQRARAEAERARAQALLLETQAKVTHMQMALEQQRAATAAGLHYPGQYGAPVHIDRDPVSGRVQITSTDHRALLPPSTPRPTPKENAAPNAPTEPLVVVPTGRELLLNGSVTQALSEGYIILGMGTDGTLKRLKIKRCFSTLVSGLPSTGKTTTVFWIVCQLTLIGAKLWLVDPHMYFEDEEGNRSLAAELSELGDSFVFPPCEGSAKEVKERISFMYAELRRRQKPGYIVRAENTIIGVMDEFNSIADACGTDVVMVTHEGTPLNLAQTLALIEREGRKYGLHFMLIGHRWARQDIGGDNAVRTNATTYLCHKLNDQRQADLLLGGGQGKKVLLLTIGSYWITGPTWNAEPAQISTPMISAVDLPILLEIKRRQRNQRVDVTRPENVVEGSLAISEIISTAASDPVSTAASDQPSGDRDGGTTGDASVAPVERQEIAEPRVLLPPGLKAKLPQVIDLVGQGKGQNEIVREVWQVNPKDRAGMAAAAELRQILAYLAEQHKRQTA